MDMSDTDSVKSGASSTSTRRVRICGICGKKETTQWPRHWRTHHKDKIAFE